MTRPFRLSGLAGLAGIALGLLASAPGAEASVLDGNWTVLVVTEKGTCDKAFRYEVAVAAGRVRYAGREAVNFNGTVSANGAVSVDIKMGEQGATGTGRLAANTGTGTWRGTGSNGTCTGRWEAERR